MNKDKYFKLFANCIPVKGLNRSTICDLQRNEFELIPNDLYEILTEEIHQYTISEIEKKRDQDIQNLECVQEYFSFLLEKDLGFLCDYEEMSMFPGIELNWESPVEITNAIIDFGVNSSHDLLKISKALDSLGCHFLELRFYYCIPLKVLEKIVSFFKLSRIKTIQISTQYHESISIDEWDDFCSDHQRIKRITLFSSPREEFVTFKRTFSSANLRADVLDSAGCCGKIHPGNFRVNLSLFSEAQSYNSCLNKKLGIDIHGNIKNCPSSNASYGNIRENDIVDVVLFNTEFRKIWEVNRDQIKICKMCEFRYICTDCRVFIQDPTDILSKPLKCSYDPETSKWEKVN